MDWRKTWWIAPISLIGIAYFLLPNKTNSDSILGKRKQNLEKKTFKNQFQKAELIKEIVTIFYLGMYCLVNTLCVGKPMLYL